MSACPTCQSANAQMPQRIVVIVDGVTYIQPVSQAKKLTDLQTAAAYIQVLIDQEKEKVTRLG